jgi:hypothetical protein
VSPAVRSWRTRSPRRRGAHSSAPPHGEVPVDSTPGRARIRRGRRATARPAAPRRAGQSSRVLRRGGSCGAGARASAVISRRRPELPSRARHPCLVADGPDLLDATARRRRAATSVAWGWTGRGSLRPAAARPGRRE